MASYTTANGTGYKSWGFSTASGNKAWWGVADNAINNEGITLILYCHGNTGSHTEFDLSKPYTGFRHWLMDNGYAWVESAGGGGSSWGNAEARVAYREAFDYVNERLDVKNIIVVGSSMGGLVSNWLFIHEPVISAKALGLMVVSGTLDLEKRIGPPPGSQTLPAAFGLSPDGSDWEEKLRGFDPMKYPVEVWKGKKVIQLYGTNDATVSPEIHAIPWIEKYGSQCSVLDVDVRIGGDHSQTNGSWLQTDALTGFVQKLSVIEEPPVVPEPEAPIQGIYKIEHSYLVGDGGVLQPYRAQI